MNASPFGNTHHYELNRKPWRVMPSLEAERAGFFDRNFSSKVKALAYKKEIVASFPDSTVNLLHLPRWRDVNGGFHDTREAA